MKKSRILQYLFSICFILFAFLQSVNFWCFNEKFYENEHNKIILYGKHVNEHIGISNQELKELTSFTLDYLNDADASLDLIMNINGEYREVFTNDEKLHMVDVRKLNLDAKYIRITSLILMIISMLLTFIKKDKLSELRFIYKKVLLSFISFFSIIGLWIIFDFDSFWTLFHKIFFASNNLWILDLRKDILIMIVPPQFFNDLVIRILFSFILCIVLLVLVLRLLDRKGINND